MNETAIVFLKSSLSREKFNDALSWIKAQPKRLYLAELKLWVLDMESTPDDPGWAPAIDNVFDNGWNVVGFTLWDVNRSLFDNKKAIEALAVYAVERNVLGSKSK